MRRSLLLPIITTVFALAAVPSAHAGGVGERPLFTPEISVQTAKVSVTTGKVTDPKVTLKLTPSLTSNPTTTVKVCLAFGYFKLGCRTTTRAPGTYEGTFSSMTGKRLQAWMALVPVEVFVSVPYLDTLPVGLLTPRNYETQGLLRFAPVR